MQQLKIKNRLAQLKIYFPLFMIFGICLLFILGSTTSGEVTIDKNSLDTSKGQTYSSSFDDILNSDGSHTLFLYSGTRNVYENGKWKRIENARTLEDKGFEWRYLEEDKNFEIEIETSEYNFSYVKKLKLKSNVEGAVPFKIGGITRFIVYGELELENIYVGNIFAYNFTFGDHSTTIILQDADLENKGDNAVLSTQPTYNRGAQTTYFKIGTDLGNEIWRAYFKFNTSKIGAGQTILNATFWGWHETDQVPQSPYEDLGIYHVYNQTWWEGDQNGAAGPGNFNDQMCGSAFDDSGQCNLTAESVVNSNDVVVSTWTVWNVTRMLRVNYDAGYSNFSFVIRSTDESADDKRNMVTIDPKEWGFAAERPFLRIEHEVTADVTPPLYYYNSTNITTPFISKPVSHNIEWTDEIALSLNFIEINITGVVLNWTTSLSGTSEDVNITNITGSFGKYYWKSYTNDSSGNWNETNRMFITVTDAPPVTTSVAINPSTAYITDTLDCGAIITNDNGWAWTNFTWYFQDRGVGAWYVNRTETMINITSGAYGNTTNDISAAWLDKDDEWICEAISYDGGGSSTLNSSSVTILEVAPTITIIYPVNGVTYTDNVTTLDYVYTSVNPDMCIYSLNETANITSICGVANITGLNALEGANIWKIFINSTYGTLAKDEVTFDFVKWVENYQVYNNETYETDNETFIVNFTLRGGANLYSAELVYNGTSYAISDIETSGDDVILTKIMDIPLNPRPFENTTKEFYWGFVYTYGGSETAQNLTAREQNVSFINFQLCNTTYATEAVNFTFMDELTGLEIDPHLNKTSIEATFKYWLGDGSIYRNYSYSNITSNGSQYQFCIHPYFETFSTDMDMDYEAVDYAPRTYHFRAAPLDNVSNDIDLNLMFLDDATKFFFEVRKGMLVFAGATVTISKYNTGEDIWETVSIRETDVDGEFIEYMELDKTYRFSFVKDGVSYGYIDKAASCAESPCEITLQIEEAIEHLWSGYYAVYATNVAYTLDYTDDDMMVTYSFTDLTGLAQNFRLYVTEMQYNQSSTTVCNKLLYTTIGELTCNMTGYEGDFTARGYVSKSPERIVDIIHFIISLIKETLGVTGILVSLFIIITIGLVGVWNPSVAVVLTAFAILMMKLLEFVAFGWTTVILVFILGGILVYQMKR